MNSDRIKLDEKEKEEQREYLNEVLEELRKLSSVAETLEDFKKYVRKQAYLNDYRFEIKISSEKVDRAYELTREFKEGIDLLYDHLYSEIDWPYTHGLEGAIERLSKVSIEAYHAKSEEGIWGKELIWTSKDTGASPLDNLDEGEYELHLTRKNKVYFMDLMRSELTRDLKKTQYEMYCDINEVDVVIKEAKYEELMNLMYRSSEFSYLTGTEKIVNFIDTVAVVVVLAVMLGPLAGGAAPTGLVKVARLAGWYLDGKNVVLLILGVDVNGDKLTPKQREELLASVVGDMVVNIAAWGLGKIYSSSLSNIDDVDDVLKNVNGVDDIDDVDDALKNVSGPGAWESANESMSEFSKKYQKYITGADDGMVYKVDGVKFDGFKDGVLLEVKGDHSFLVDDRGDFFYWFSKKNSLINQATNQLRVAKGTPIKWYFSDSVSMNAFMKLFEENGITGIEYILKPMP